MMLMHIYISSPVMKKIIRMILESFRKPDLINAFASGGASGWMALVALGAMALAAFAIYEIVKVATSP